MKIPYGEADFYSLTAVAGLPVSRLRLFAKAGFLSWKADGRIVSLAGETPFSLDAKDLLKRRNRP